MRCEKCSMPLEADMRFCPECGSPVPPRAEEELLEVFHKLNQDASDVTEQADPELSALAEEIRALEQESDPLTEEAPADDTARPQAPDIPPRFADADRPQTRTAPVTRMYRSADASGSAMTRLYGGAAAPDDNFDVRRTEAMHGRSASARIPLTQEENFDVQRTEASQGAAVRAASPITPPAAEAPLRRGVSYEDDYEQRLPDARLQREEAPDPAETPEDVYPRFDEERGYPRTTAGKRIGSICLSVLMLALLLCTLISGVARITMTHDNIRMAAQDGLTQKTLLTSYGRITAAQYLRKLIGEENAQALGVTDEMLNNALTAAQIPALAADILSDYADYVLYDKAPEHLNADTILTALDLVNDACGTAVFDTASLRSRINGGDLSFLSIDASGEYFQARYGVNPKLLSTLGSVPVLAICGGMALLCMVLIFLINSANPPAGLRFNGTVLILCGGVSLLTAAGMIVLSLIRETWLLSVLLRCASLWFGAIGLVLFVIGIVLAAVAGSLKRRAARLSN